jgi:hypothetical protein
LNRFSKLLFCVDSIFKAKGRANQAASGKMRLICPSTGKSVASKRCNAQVRSWNEVRGAPDI